MCIFSNVLIRAYILATIYGAIASAAPAPSPVADLTVYVNPFIGTEGPVPNSGANSGDTFPGVGVPFGVVKLGPDTNELDQTTNPFAGYTPDGNGS